MLSTLLTSSPVQTWDYNTIPAPAIMQMPTTNNPSQLVLAADCARTAADAEDWIAAKRVTGLVQCTELVIVLTMM
jgi:hypothetical protein